MKNRDETVTHKGQGEFRLSSGTLKCPLCDALNTSVVTDENKRYLYCEECGYSCCYPESGTD